MRASARKERAAALPSSVAQHVLRSPEPGATPPTTEGAAGHDFGQIRVHPDCAVATTSPASPILTLAFGNGVGELSSVERARADDFVTSWTALGGKAPVRVDGYASEPGGPELNLSLSCERALSTVDELMKPGSGSMPGVPRAQLSWFAHGETNEFSATDEAPNRVAVISTPAPAPVQPQELLIMPSSAPAATDCGGYHWAADWLLRKDSDVGGHIVQHLVADYEIHNLLGMDITTSIVKRHWDYWEAWSVDAGEGTAKTIPATPGTPSPTKGGKPAPTFPVPYTAGTDTFADPERGLGTRGKIVVTGDAQFYEGLVTLPAHFVYHHPDTQAGSLRSTTTDPKLTGGTPNVDHDLTVDWDCRFGRTRTNILSHTP